MRVNLLFNTLCTTMRKPAIVLFFLISLLGCQQKNTLSPAPALDFSLANSLDSAYGQFVEKSIQFHLLKQADILPLIDKLEGSPVFKVKRIGKSVEGRDLHLLKWGSGPVKVLLWSQMHGDESTATQALFDIFNFFEDHTGFEKNRQALLEAITFYAIPMLNPDGAEVFKRRNALEIDLNRDALRLQSPEAELLKMVRDSLQPDFGFNLHDQSTLYSVGTSNKQAAISFLAPAFNHEKEVNLVRKKAMQVIIGVDKMLQQKIPGHVGRYDDTFEPRAFGDNIQRWGTSTILVETGGYPNDPEKQFLRKINFLLLMQAFELIAKESYSQFGLDDYYQIPENARYFYDLVVRNVQVELYGNTYLMDIGVNQSRFHPKNEKAFKYRSAIAEIGDMHVFHGYTELDAAGARLVTGKVAESIGASPSALTPEVVLPLLKQGYLFVKAGQYTGAGQYVPLPINLLVKGGAPEFMLRQGSHANFLLEKDGVLQYAVVNGFLQSLQGEWEPNGHGLVY